MRLLFDTTGTEQDLKAIQELLQGNEILVTVPGRKTDAEEAAGKIRTALPEDIKIIPGTNHPFASRNPENPDLPARSTKELTESILSFLDHKEKTTVILLAGASDLALVLQADAKASDHIERILFAGGCYCFGDVTPVAEANAYFDPEGLQYLLHKDIPFYFLPLELFEETGLSCAQLCLLALKQPESFSFVKYRAETETYAEYTRGMTVIYRNNVDHYDYNDDEIHSAVQVRVKEEDKNAFYPEADPEEIRNLAERGTL